MKTFEIVLVCFLCGAESQLGYIQADTAYDAKYQAVERWPDARDEGMIIRRVEQQEMCLVQNA